MGDSCPAEINLMPLRVDDQLEEEALVVADWRLGNPAEQTALSVRQGNASASTNDMAGRAANKSRYRMDRRKSYMVRTFVLNNAPVLVYI